MKLKVTLLILLLFCRLSSAGDLNTKYFVTESDLCNMLDSRHCTLGTKNSSHRIRTYKVTPYGLEDNQTLFYIVNYDGGGWEIISADKRSPMTWAHGEGEFQLESLNPNAKFWLDMQAEQILELRKNESYTNEEHLAQWGILSSKNSDKSSRDVSIYHYYLGSDDTHEYIDDIGPLLYTQWGQSGDDEMYNRYCPLETDEPNKRAPAGCVAVAGAQVLYFLYREQGISLYMPNGASCSGVVGNYTQSFAPSCNTYYITKIPLHSGDIVGTNKLYSRIFMAWIGNKTGVRYTNDGTYAYTNDLTKVFSLYDVNCTYDSTYDFTTVRNSILGKIPVIVGGSRLPSSSSGNDKIGHCWVIDGYRKIKTTHNVYYYRCGHQLTDEEINALTLDDYNYVQTSTTYTSEFHMNWGWNGTYDTYYLVNSNDWSPNGTPYNINLDMIYGFYKRSNN